MSRMQFIFITMFLDALGIGLLIPVLPDILRRFLSDPTMISLYFGYFLSAYSAMQFLASPILGSLSDQYGRRPVLLISLLGASIDYLFMAFAPNLALLFIGRVISGLTGASMTVAASFIADISTDSTRSKNFGLIGAAWGLGFIIGPVAGGLLHNLGANAPFLTAAGMNLLNFGFGVFILPESLGIENRRKLTLQSIDPIRSLVKILRPSPIASFIWVYFLMFFAGQIHPVNWTLYMQNKFAWTAAQVGISLAFVGITNALTQAILPRYVIPKIGEQKSFVLGVLISALGFVMFSLMTQDWMAYLAIAVYAFSGIAFPALQSIISKNVPANEQGELQGSLVSLGSVSAIIAPFFFTQIFVHFSNRDNSNYFPGAAYLSAAGLSLLALALGLYVGRTKPLLSKT